MEVRYSMNLSSPSHRPLSSRLAYGSSERISPPRRVICKQSPRVSLGRGMITGDDSGRRGSPKSLSSRLQDTRRRCGFTNSLKVELGPAQLGSQDRTMPSFVCTVKFDSEQDVNKGQEPGLANVDQEGEGRLVRGAGQIACWVVTVVYVGWLFLLPYAPGDPVWAISPPTIQMLIDLSLNFFFVLPLASSLANAAGFDGLTAPLLHPTSEALFNFVLGWTLLFAPLLFTDRKRDRFGGSLEILWIIQMFLTNTVLAPYMAIRLNSLPADRDKGSLASGPNLESLSKGMTTGASIVGIVGALVGLISILWAFIGRPEAAFGGVFKRWDYFLNYVGSERLAYAFVWDMALYTFFQPWLIGDNLGNVKMESRETVRILRFVPYVGLVAYVFGLQKQDRVQSS